jgi:hypothetical protein
MLLGCAAGRCPATTILGLSLYRSHATDLEKPQIRRSRRRLGRPSHRRHSFAASTPAAPAPCCTPSADQFPIEPAEPGAPIPRLPSLAAFERRPRCAWQRSRWAGIRNPSHERSSRPRPPTVSLAPKSGRIGAAPRTVEECRFCCRIGGSAEIEEAREGSQSLSFAVRP